MISPFRIRFPQHGNSHLACLAPAKRAGQLRTYLRKRQFTRRHKWQDQDHDVRDMQLDPANRLKRYSGSEFLAPLPKEQLPLRYCIPSSAQRVVNLRSRQGMQDLRVLLGYAPDTEASRRLQRYLSIVGTKQPPRFVSLDTEYSPHHGPLLKFHLGLSIFDTRTLQAFREDSLQENDLEPAVQSHHYVVNDPYFFIKKTRQFSFGTPEAISLSNLAVKLKELVMLPTILVAHGPSKELRVLRKLGIWLDNVNIFDTAWIPREPLQLPYAPSLGGLLQELGIPYEEHLLHVGGNDARFTLQALLMMIAMDAERYLGSSELPAWVSTFRAIAQAKLPDPTTLKPMTRKEARLFRKKERRRLRERARRRRRFEEARLLRERETTPAPTTPTPTTPTPTTLKPMTPTPTTLKPMTRKEARLFREKERRRLRQRARRRRRFEEARLLRERETTPAPTTLKPTTPTPTTPTPTTPTPTTLKPMTSKQEARLIREKERRRIRQRNRRRRLVEEDRLRKRERRLLEEAASSTARPLEAT